MCDTMTVEDLIKKIKHLTKQTKIVNLAGKEFYGKILVFQVQAGKLTTCKVNQAEPNVAFMWQETIKFD